jgi:Rrf2 family transcriptional regulator, nitric oxide-sensitive transcriptional repressor
LRVRGFVTAGPRVEHGMFSQTTEYALRAMACLAMKPADLVPTPVLAAQTKVPANYLAKVLQQLAAAKLITGRRGVGGGYKLAKPAGDIRLLDVINAVTKVSRIETCPLGLTSHGSRLCALHKKADEAAAAVIEVYNGTTLHDLLEDPNPNKPLCEARAAATLTVSANHKR